MRICKPYPFEKLYRLKDPQNGIAWRIFDGNWYSREERFHIADHKFNHTHPRILRTIVRIRVESHLKTKNKWYNFTNARVL